MQNHVNGIEDSAKNDLPIKNTEENDSEIEDIEKNNSELKTICQYCLQPIESGAKVCHYCGKYQSKLNRLPYYFATLAIPLAVVIFAGLQVYVNILQYDEAKAKRVKAEQVLKKAEAVLIDVKTKSEEIRKEVEITLSDAKESLETANKVSKEAKVEANKVLTLTRNESKAVIEKSNEARNGFDAASKEVRLNLQESNERIILAENNSLQKYNNITLKIEELKSNFSVELAILKERNYLVALGDNAIGQGDRNSLNKLEGINSNIYESSNKKSIALAEILRIKSYYTSGTRLAGIEISVIGLDRIVLKDDDLTTDILIEKLHHDKNWQIRGRAAQLLAKRKEKKVMIALVKSMLLENCLDVLEESISSFAQVTGYKIRDALNSDYAIAWWGKNQGKVYSELTAKK